MNKPLRRVISATLALSLSVTLAVNAYAEEIEKVHKHEAVSTEAVLSKKNRKRQRSSKKHRLQRIISPKCLILKESRDRASSLVLNPRSRICAR